MGKGSAPRPFEVDHGTFANNWDQIFGKKSNPKTLEDQAFNDLVSPMQLEIDQKMAGMGEGNDKKSNKTTSD